MRICAFTARGRIFLPTKQLKRSLSLDHVIDYAGIQDSVSDEKMLINQRNNDFSQWNDKKRIECASETVTKHVPIYIYI